MTLDPMKFRELVEDWQEPRWREDLGCMAPSMRAGHALQAFLLSHASELLALVEAEGWRTMESAPVCEPFLATCRVKNQKGDQWWETYRIVIDDSTGEIDTDIDQPWSLEDYEFWRPFPPPPENAQ